MKRELILLNERDFYEYTTEKMIIQLQGEKIVFEPKGKNTISSNGRIDMKGNNGFTRFLLVDKNATGPKVTSTNKEVFEALKKEKRKEIEYEWKIVTPAPRVEYIELNEISFTNAVIAVSEE